MSRAAFLALGLNWFVWVAAHAADQTQAVSGEVQAIYARTQSAQSEADFTDVARACSKIIPDTKRTEVDRKYATKLFAWALNRRGEVRSEAAARFVQEGKADEAQKLDQFAGKDFATAAQYAPENWRIHHNLAISSAMQGKFEAAIASLSTVIKLKTDYPNAYYNRAELYFEREKFDEAVADYSRAVELAPNDASYFNGRAHAHFMLDKTQEALADYAQAIELDPTSAAYMTDLADALQSAGLWEDSAFRYRQAIAVDKSYARAYRNVSWLLSTCPDQRFRNPNLALSAAKKAIELGDKDYRAIDTLAAATAATGETTEAARLMRQAVAAAPQSNRAELTQRSALYEKGGKFVQAVAKPLVKQQVVNQQPEVRTASATGPAR